MSTDVLDSALADPSGAIGHPLTGLRQSLAWAGRRSTYVALLQGLTDGVLIALALFCLLQLLYGLLGGLAPWLAFDGIDVPAWLYSWRPAPAPQHLVVAAAAFVAGAGAAMARGVLQRPEVDKLARAADREFRLHECLSTALEVASAPARRNGVVAEALLQRAEERSGAVDARRLVPVRLPRSAIGVPVLLIVAALLAANPPPPLLQDAFSGTGGEVAGELFTLDELAETADDLRRIAAILQQDATRRADPGLQAVARQVEALGADMATNPLISRDNVVAEMERLLTAAAAAYGQAGETPASPRNLTRLLAAALDKVYADRPAPLNETDNAGADGANPANEGREGRESVDNPFEAPVLDADAEIDPAPPMPGLTVNPNQLGDAEPGADTNPGRLDRAVDDVAEVYDEDGPVVDRQPNEGRLVGAAGGADAGDFAGEGAVGLGGNPDAGRVDPIDVAWEMFLEAELRDGRVIRLQLPPLTELMPVDGNAPGAAGGWRAITEREVTRSRLRALDRDVVGRYFEALTVGRGE